MTSVRRTTCWLAALIMGGVVARLAGQAPENDLAPPESRLKPGYLHLDVRELFLEFEGSFEGRWVRSEPPGQRALEQSNRDWEFREKLGFALSGDFIDPNLLSFDASFAFGLDQERFKETFDGITRTESDRGTLLEYDVSVDVLREKPLSLSAYARQLRQRIPRRFLPSLTEDRREAGAAAHLTLGTYTGEMGIDWSDVERSGNRLREDDERLRTWRFYSDNRWSFSDRHSLRLYYEHADDHSDYQGGEFSYDTERDELRLDHELQFGDAGRHRLDTVFRYTDERGDLARDEMEFTPRLSLRHTDEFETVYRYTYYRLEQGVLDLDRHRGDMQAIWRPTDELRLSGDVFALREQIDGDVETHEYGGTAEAAYRRRLFHGELSANLGLTAERSTTLGDVRGGVVRGEVHDLDATRPAFLNELDINIASIIAYDAARSRAFIPGIDYTIMPVGRRTVVRRLLSGRIADGELIYFDYDYDIPTGSGIDTYRADFSVEHAFDFGLTPYYSLDLRRQYADGSRGEPAIRDNSERHRFGLRYERPAWSVSAEGEIFHDTYEPYDAYHLTGQAALWRDEVHAVNASMLFSEYWFTGEIDRRNVWFFEADLTDRMQLNQYLSATLGAAYRHEDDSIDGLTNGVDIELGLRLVRGYLDVDLTAEYDLLSIVDNRDEGYGVWLNVRRDLSHLLPGRRHVR